MKFAEANLRRRLYVSSVSRSPNRKTGRGNKAELFQVMDGGEGVTVNDEYIEKWATEYLELLTAQKVDDLPPISLTEDESEKWNEILQGLSQRLNKDVFNTWFRPVLCEGMDLTSGELRLRAGQITSDWISLYYVDLIQGVASEIGFPSVDIRWTIIAEQSSIEEFQRRFTSETLEQIVAKASELKEKGN